MGGAAGSSNAGAGEAAAAGLAPGDAGGAGDGGDDGGGVGEAKKRKRKRVGPASTGAAAGSLRQISAKRRGGREAAASEVRLAGTGFDHELASLSDLAVADSSSRATSSSSACGRACR